MSFFGKTMSNQFPDWSKVRFDQSAVGNILLDVIGKRLEKTRQAGLNYKDQRKVLENYPLLTFSNSFIVNLPNYPIDINRKRIASVALTDSSGNLKLYDTWNRYNLDLPENVSIEKIKTNHSNIIDTFAITEGLRQVMESYDFKRQEKYLIFDCRSIDSFLNTEVQKDFGTVINETEGKYKQEVYSITVRGLDYFGKGIEETLSIEKKKIYITKNKFIKICSLNKESEYIKQRDIVGGPAIEFIGFNGLITLKNYDFEGNTFVLPDTLSIADFNSFAGVYGEDSHIENNLKVSLVNEESVSHLAYIHSFFKKDYLFFNENNLTDQSSGEELLTKSTLCDTNGIPVKVDNIAYDRRRKVLYGINTNKDLYIWELERPALTYKNLILESKDLDLDLEVEKNFYSLNETAHLHLILSRPKQGIKRFCIIRHKPSTVIADTVWEPQFLDSQNLWSDEISYRSGNDRIDNYENAVNFRFSDILDEYGQYDYYVVSFKEEINVNSKLELKKVIEKEVKANSGKVRCTRSSLLVPSMIAKRLYKLNDLPGVNKEKYMLAFETFTNELLVLKNQEVYKVKELLRRFFFNWSEGVLFTQDKLEDAVFTVNFQDETDYICEVIYE